MVINCVPQLITTCGGYAIAGLMFAIFLIFNRGIVLGDKDAHTSVIHVSQLLHFAFFSIIFGFPWLVTRSNLSQFANTVRKNKLKAMISSMIIVAVSYFSCHVHPYLLADNRHYTFYIWRRFLGCPTTLFSKSLLYTPLYGFTLYTTISMLGTKDTLWKYLFSICLCISIVPQKLLEFRYFIVPFTIWRLNIPNNNSSNSNNTIQLSIEFVLYTFVNVFTIYIFLYKSFKWPQSSDAQRFMW